MTETLTDYKPQDLEKQGVRFDASGYPENLRMESRPLNRSG